MVASGSKRRLTLSETTLILPSLSIGHVSLSYFYDTSSSYKVANMITLVDDQHLRS